MNLCSNRICSCLYIFGNIELRIVIGPFTITYLLSIYPDIYTTVYTIKMQHYFFSVPSGRYGKFATVWADRIYLNFIGIPFLRLDKRRIIFKRISYIGINRSTISVHFPIRRNRDFLPCRYIIVHFIKVGRPFGRLFHPIELPVPIQGKVIIGIRHFPRFLKSFISFETFNGRIRNVCIVTGFFINPENQFILPFGFTTNNHFFRRFYRSFHQSPNLWGIG